MRRLNVAALLFLLPGLFSGCGGPKPGDHLGVVILPEKVIIASSAMRTCLDITSASTTPSATAPAVTFPKFRLDWTDTENTLLISSVRVTFTGNGISEGKFTTDISGDELDALFGQAQLAPNKFVDISHSTETDPRGKSRSLAPCRFTVGSIPIKKDAPSFRASITVDVIGTSLSDDFTRQSFVKQTVRASADYVAY